MEVLTHLETITARDVFSGMKENFDATAAAGVKAEIVYELTGEHSGVWVLRVDDGRLEVDEGFTNNHPNATISMSSDDFVQVALGRLNPMTAFMSGKIKIKGDLLMAQKFQKFFRQPK